MAKVTFDLEGNFEPALSGVDKFNNSLEETQKSQTNLKNGFKATSKEAQSFSTATVAGMKKVTTETDKTNKNVKSLSHSFSDMASNLGLGNIVGEVGQLGTGLGDTIGRVQQMGVAWKALNVIFQRSIIGLIITAIIGLVTAITTFFRASEEGGDKLAEIFAVIDVFVRQLTKAFIALGKVVVEAFSFAIDKMSEFYDFLVNNFLTGIEEIADGLRGLGLEETANKVDGFAASLRKAKKDNEDWIKSLRDAGKAIAKLEDDLEGATIAVGLANNRLRTEIDKSIKSLRNRGNTYEENLKIIDKIGAAEEQRLKNSNSLINMELELEKRKFLVGQNNQAASEKSFNQFVNGQIDAIEFMNRLEGDNKADVVKNIADILNKREEATRESMVLEERLDALRVQFAEREKARIDKLVSDLITAEKRRATELENVQKQRLLNGEINQEQYSDNIEDIQTKSLERQKGILAKYGRDTIDLDKAILDIQLKNYDAYLKQVKALTDASNKARLEGLTGEERLNAVRENELKEIEIVEKSIEDLNVQLGKKKDLTEEQQNQIQLLRDQANRKYLEGELQLQKEETELNEQIQIEKIKRIENNNLSEIELEKFKQAEILKVQIEAAQKKLFLLEGNNSKEAELEREKLQTFIANSQNALNELEKQSTGFSLQKLLGLDDNQFQSALNNLKTFKDSVLSIYSSMLDEEININQQRISEFDRSINERQKALETEIALSKEGFASNVEGTKKQLEEEKKARDKALKTQEELQKKKRRIETAEQLGSLVTASANILKGYSTLPIVGQVLAIAAIAGMFAAFAAAKANASKASKLAHGGNLGDVLDVPSHAKGGHKVMTRRGLFEIEGGEMITNIRSTKKHQRLLNAINRDKESEIFEAMLPYIDISEEGVRLNKVRAMRTVVSSGQNLEKSYYPGMIKSLSAIEKNTGNIQEKQVIAVTPGSTIIEYTKTGKRVIRNV